MVRTFVFIVFQSRLSPTYHHLRILVSLLLLVSGPYWLFQTYLQCLRLVIPSLHRSCPHYLWLLILFPLLFCLLHSLFSVRHSKQFYKTRCKNFVELGGFFDACYEKFEEFAFLVASPPNKDWLGHHEASQSSRDSCPTPEQTSRMREQTSRTTEETSRSQKNLKKNWTALTPSSARSSDSPLQHEPTCRDHAAASEIKLSMFTALGKVFIPLCNNPRNQMQPVLAKAIPVRKLLITPR